MDIKIIFAALSLIIGLIGFFPYLRDIIKNETHPHIYTWVIWAITQGTATAGMWTGGAGVGAITSTIGTALILVIIFFSLKDGDKQITKSDTFVLILALSAIAVWWFLENPLLAVIMVSAIDVIGYIPTFRKSYMHPWQETALSWTIFTISNVFSVLALESYNLLTMTYFSTVIVINTVFIVFLLIRRRTLRRVSFKLPQ